MEIIKFLGLLCMVWLFTTGSAPIQFIKEFLGLHEDSNTKNVFKKVVIKLINCDLCSGFWFGLAVYQNIWMACIVSICAEGFGRLLAILKFK